MRTVLCVGESMVLVAPSSGTTIEDADQATLSVAGAESNTAQTLAELGHAVTWLSRLGTDPFGTKVLDVIGRSGVDTSLVRRDPETPTGVFFKAPSANGTVVHYFRAGSAASCLSPADLDGLDFAGTDLVHVTGVTPALSPTCRAMVEELFKRAGGSGAVVSFDVNYRPALWDVPTAGPVLRDLAARADLVFVGRDEAEALWGTVSAADVRAYLSARRLVVKDAAIGATVFSGDNAVFEPALRVEVVEPVGAGDAFAAGFLSALLHGEEDHHALRMSHRVGALALSTTADRADVSNLRTEAGLAR